MKRLGFFLAALLAVFPTQSLSGQGTTGTIRGRVTDSATQAPLANVQVTFGRRSALTLYDGRFVLSGITPGTDTLKARSLGYTPILRVVSVAAGQSLTLDLALTAQAVSLSEIIVTGYGQQTAGSITGAVTQVSTEEFNTGRIISPAQLISAKVAGVQVIDNNEPGGGLSIRIRGSTSWTASSDPLYVIDGMVVGGGAGTGLSAGRDGLNFLNPNDIESITVLRDASSAAIYGANAANGVVLITTKGRSGLPGKQGARWEYTGSVTGSSIDKLPTMLNAEQFRSAVQTYAPQYSSLVQNENTDWWNEVTQSGFGQDHNLSVTSADPNSFYRFSIGYLNQDGVIVGTNVERVTLGLSYRQAFFNERLGLRVNAKGSRSADTFTPGGVLGNAAQMASTQPIFDPNNQETGYYNWPGGNQAPDNPVEIANLAIDNGVTYRSVGNVQADYRLLEGLKANVNLGYDIANVERSSYYPSTIHRQAVTSQGSDYRRNPSEAGLLFDTYLNYAKPIGPGSLDLTGGYSYSKLHGEYPSYTATGLSGDFLEGNGVIPAENESNTMDVQDSKLISFFGRLNYNIKDKYLLGASLRYDGSSRFGSENAWGTFPSLSVGWRLTEEGFFGESSFLSDLKLRASWAKTGNQNFGNYRQYSTYKFGNNQVQIPFGDTFIPTIRPSAVDPNIKWEGTTAYNVGLDFGLWNDRLTGSFDWYTKTTDDMIFNVPVAAATNFSNYVTTNIGSMQNTGVELGINYRALDGNQGKLGWSFGFNASHNANELLSINPSAASAQAQQIQHGGIAGGVGSTIQILLPGYSIYSFFVYQHKLENGKPVYADVNGDNVVSDDEIYVDLNGDGRINVDDRRPFHNADPDWMLGFSNYLTFKRFNLDFTLRAWLGNYVYNNVASQMGTYSELARDNGPHNLHASVLETGFRTQQLLSDYYVQDGSFLRMDNISLGYRFAYRDQPFRLFVSMQNAFTISGYSGVDPTAGINGIDNNIYPRSRQFTGGLTIQF